MVTLTLVMGLLSGHSVLAQLAQSVAGCGAGNQDATCLGRVYAVPQTPPTCPNAAGYTTAVAATWIGSGYSQPVCGYQAPPVCPAGEIQTQAPTWNGANWVDLGCEPPAEPPSNPGPDSMCTANLPGGFMLGQQANFNSSWSNPDFAIGTYSFFPTTDAAYAAPLYGPPYQNACGGFAQDYIGYCAIQPSGTLDGEVQVSEPGTTGQCNH